MKPRKTKSQRIESMTTTTPFFGYESEPSTGFGLAAGRKPNKPTAPQLSLHDGNSHLLTIGGTGSGKTNQIIANLLLYEGSVIVVDIKGDAVRATERFRRTVLKQDTYVLDPFGATGRVSDRLDPLDICTLPNIEVESESQTIAAALATDHLSVKDPYWHTQGSSLLSANIAHLLTLQDPAKRSLNCLIDAMFADDMVYHQAVLLDTVIKKGSFAYAGIASFLQLPDSTANTRFCVLSTAQSMLHAFRSSSVRSVMGPSTIKLADLLTGKPVTIYLVLPIERMLSHGVVLKLWLDVLLQVLMRRTYVPEVPSWVIIDEAAQIGPSNTIKTVATYMRAYGVRLWQCWQDASQLRAIYPLDWQTLVNNTSALTFMPGTALAAKELAILAGISPTALSELGSQQQLVCETGKSARVVDMVQYWREPMFKGRFDTPLRYLSKQSSGKHQAGNGL